MRDHAMVRAARLATAAGVALALAGCAQLQNVRVAPLPTANSSSYRSMLADFNPLASQHRSSSYDQLQSPEDRGRRLFWYHY